MKHTIEDINYIIRKSRKSWAKYFPSLTTEEERRLLLYASIKLGDAGIDLVNKSVRLLTVTTDVNEGFAVIVLYGVDEIHSKNYVILPDTVIEF